MDNLLTTISICNCQTGNVSWLHKQLFNGISCKWSNTFGNQCDDGISFKVMMIHFWKSHWNVIHKSKSSPAGAPFTNMDYLQSQHGYVIKSIIICGMKSFIHSKNSMGPPMKKFHPTLYQACNYLSMLGLKLNHLCKWGYRKIRHFAIYIYHIIDKNNWKRWYSLIIRAIAATMHTNSLIMPLGISRCLWFKVWFVICLAPSWYHEES